MDTNGPSSVPKPSKSCGRGAKLGDFRVATPSFHPSAEETSSTWALCAKSIQGGEISSQTTRMMRASLAFQYLQKVKSTHKIEMKSFAAAKLSS